MPSESEDESTYSDSYFVATRSTDTSLTHHSSDIELGDDANSDNPCKLQGVDKGKAKQVEEEEEEFENDDEEDCITTCTIIRPLPKSSLRHFFFRSSSNIILHTSSSDSRRSRRLARRDVFEEQVDHFQAQRANELNGSAGVRVWVTKTLEIYAEESWRQCIQKLLYGNLDGKAPHIGPVIGRGD